MLKFLSSLFSEAPPPGGPDKALVEAAIERVLDATDPRLRGFGDYRKRLYAAVQQGVMHVQTLVDSLPAPVEMGPRTFSADPRLRAFFASPDSLRDAIGGAPAMTEFLAQCKGPYPEHIFGLIAPEMQERSVLGMQLQGDQVRRDVLQKVVDFSGHRFIGAAGSELEARRELKKRAFDYLAELALKRILGVREKRTELEQQIRLLQRKLDAMQAGNWGLEPMLSKEAPDQPDYRSLGQQIEAVETELMALPCSSPSLEHRFDCINAVFGQPEEWISLRQIHLHIDAMSVIVEDPGGASMEPLELTELFSSNGDRRVVLFGYYPRDELPPEPDFLKEAQRVLGR